jgi:hypothetical protein
MSDNEGPAAGTPNPDDLALPKATVAKLVSGQPACLLLSHSHPPIDPEPEYPICYL